MYHLQDRARIRSTTVDVLGQELGVPAIAPAATVGDVLRFTSWAMIAWVPLVGAIWAVVAP